MTIEEAKKMDLGAILDFCSEWNDIHGIKEEDGKKRKGIRDATQADIDKFLG